MFGAVVQCLPPTPECQGLSLGPLPIPVSYECAPWEAKSNESRVWVPATHVVEFLTLGFDLVPHWGMNQR